MIVVAPLPGEAATSPDWAISEVIGVSVLPDAAGTAAVSGEGDWLLGDEERGDVWTKACCRSSTTPPDGGSVGNWLERLPFDAGWEGISCWVRTDEGIRVGLRGGLAETDTTEAWVACPAVIS